MKPRSRFRHFLHATISSYALLSLNILYVLGSVPLALHFLGKHEFGLWALCMQLTGYLQLIDLGMAASVSRHLIDYKDSRTCGEYGSVITTGALVLSLQGFLAFFGGVLLVYLGTPFLHIDPNLERSFTLVMLAQCAMAAIDFPGRLFAQILVAHQRNDVFNYAQIGLLLASYTVLWGGFASGLGIFSLVCANAAGSLTLLSSNILACCRLRLLPSYGNWGRPTLSKYRILFQYGKDVFWITLGAQMINATQTIVVTRTLGLDSAAVWSICTRAYTLATQLVWRPFDSSCSMLAEMIARGEQSRLLSRFRGLVVFSSSLSVGAAIMFTLCNQPFVALWTDHRISWNKTNDLLIALCLIISTLVHCHCYLPVLAKRIGFMRYVYFIEGVVFLLGGTFGAKHFGFPGMLTVSIIAMLLFTFSYGIFRTTESFALHAGEVLIDWLVPASKFLLSFGSIGFLANLSTRSLPNEGRLLVYALFVAPFGLFAFYRFGLNRELRAEIVARIPCSLAKVIKTAFGS